MCAKMRASTLFIGRACRAGEILLPDLVHIEAGGALTHRLENALGVGKLVNPFSFSRAMTEATFSSTSRSISA